jgi:hypothetical protein
LVQIESELFSNSSLQSIVIPPSVRVIDGSAFEGPMLPFLSIDNGNEIFAHENDLLIDVVGHQLIRNFSGFSTVHVSGSIEVFGSSCFAGCRSIALISFESESRLTRIEFRAFSQSSLQSILIPCSVEILCSFCFSSCESLSSVCFESNSRLKCIEQGAFSRSSLQSIVIPRNVESLPPFCFACCKSLSSLSFESGSCLARIATDILSYSSLKSFVILHTVNFIHPSAFAHVALSSISVEEGHYRFIVASGRLIDSIAGKTLACLKDKPDSLGGFALFAETVFTQQLSELEFPNESSESDSES